ncbi:MAG: molybdopterin molybdotransferase MoeA, partial [Firmicutes bacterium]|nr:molybdopterin molybdotransferase MoeA [Bacillota bacterium]
MLTVLTVEEAQKKVLENVSFQGRSEIVSLEQALGRVAAKDVYSPEAAPPFNRSTMDGFAVRASDTFGATESMPAFLSLAGEILMGEAPPRRLEPGEAMAIATGGMLPEGADTVLMVEYAEKLGADEIAAYKPVVPGENILRRGEDYEKGEKILPSGQRLRPQDLGALAGLGIREIEVNLPPQVAIVSTGDELVTPEKTPAPGQIRDINSLTLSSLVKKTGGVAHRMGIVADRREALREALEQALKKADLVVISGGSSVGVRDVTARVIEELEGGDLFFHGVSMRPGKPLIFGISCGKPVFGLSGNPVSAMIGFQLFVAPAINKMQGLPPLEEYPRIVEARLSRRLASASGREDFVRVKLERTKEGLLEAIPLFGQAG